MPEIASLMEALPYQYSPDLLWDLETRSDAINFFLQISFDDLIFFSEERFLSSSLFAYNSFFIQLFFSKIGDLFLSFRFSNPFSQRGFTPSCL